MWPSSCQEICTAVREHVTSGGATLTRSDIFYESSKAKLMSEMHSYGNSDSDAAQNVPMTPLEERLKDWTPLLSQSERNHLDSYVAVWQKNDARTLFPIPRLFS